MASIIREAGQKMKRTAMFSALLMKATKVAYKVYKNKTPILVALGVGSVASGAMIYKRVSAAKPKRRQRKHH